MSFMSFHFTLPLFNEHTGPPYDVQVAETEHVVNYLHSMLEVENTFNAGEKRFSYILIYIQNLRINRKISIIKEVQPDVAKHRAFQHRASVVRLYV